MPTIKEALESAVGRKLPSKRSRRLADKREELRNTLWPDSVNYVWSRKTVKGFTTLPRVLPLITRLITDLIPKGDASKVYLDLWFRAFDEGLVIIKDEQEMAYTAGYNGPRALRTWREHIDGLTHFGFIQCKTLGNRDIGHVLLVDPNVVVARLYLADIAPEKWWNVYVTRMSEVGAALTLDHDPTTLPEIPALVEKSKPVHIGRATRKINL